MASPTDAVVITQQQQQQQEELISLREVLSVPILLADRVIKLAQLAESSKQDSADLATQVDRLSHSLRTCVRLTAAQSTTIYDRPLRRIAADISKNLERAVLLLRKCRRGGGSFLRHVFSMTSTADFRKVSNLLESSIGDLRWLLSILDEEDGGGGANLSLPPIASNDPILAWVWSYISTLYMARDLKDRGEAANALASLALDNDRNKKMIVEEGGVLPLLKLLKETVSPESQIAAANALFNIGTDLNRVRLIVDVLGLPIIVSALNESSMKVQIAVANLVARMAELDQVAQEELVREKVTRPLISLISIDLVFESVKQKTNKNSIHSIVQMNKELGSNINNKPNSNNLSNASSFSDGGGSSRGGVGHYRKEKESETPEVKLMLQVSCANALYQLVKGCLSGCKKITETKGLLCLAKLIEKEKGELQYKCLMAVMEITVLAEVNAELRRSSFKTNLPAAKAILDQLLRLVKQETNPALQIPSIRAIGCLARTFSARETRIINPLVKHLGDKVIDVAIEASIALGKFVRPDNFNCDEHSKAIIEFEGVPSLMRLIKVNERAQMHGLVLLCYLAMSVGNNKALEEAKALTALEGAARSVITQHPELKDLFVKALQHLTLYQAGILPPKQLQHVYVPTLDRS